MERREFLVSVAAVLAGMGITGHARAQTATAYPADYNKIVEGSKSEGTVTVYSVWGEEFWPFVLEPVTQKYPWLKVEYLNLNSSEAVQRYLVEKTAGSKTADFLALNSPQAWSDLNDRGEVKNYQSPESPNLPDWALRHPGVYGMLIDADVFAWNKLLLPPELVPTSMESFTEIVKANPDKFARKLVTFPAMESGYSKLALRRQLKKHGDTMWGWLDAIGPNFRFESSAGPMIEKILAGEYLIGYALPLARCLGAVNDPARAAVFDWGYNLDGTTVGPRQAGITAACRTPNSSRLLLDTMLSLPGQAAIARTNKIPVRADLAASDLPAGAITIQDITKAVGADNVLDVYYDKSLEETNADYVAKYTKAFNVKS